MCPILLVLLRQYHTNNTTWYQTPNHYFICSFLFSSLSFMILACVFLRQNWVKFVSIKLLLLLLLFENYLS
jgi:hypothetical protein